MQEESTVLDTYSDAGELDWPEELPVVESCKPGIPTYLQETYWWAYLHPRALQVFEREWLVNLILWGNMRRLTAVVLEEIPDLQHQRILQMACVYGRFSERLATHLAKSGSMLEIIDVAAIQVSNARRKLGRLANVRVSQQNAASLEKADSSCDTTVLFFLLHEQPEDVRRQSLAEAVRVTRPGGRIIIIDYHLPHPANPLRYLMYPVLRYLEPFALDLWRRPLTDFLPDSGKGRMTRLEHYCGGLYQKMVLEVD